MEDEGTGRWYARPVFLVADGARALSFYTDVLGLAPAYPAGGGWAEFLLDGFGLCLHSGREGTASTRGLGVHRAPCAVRHGVRPNAGLVRAVPLAELRRPGYADAY